MGVRKHYHCDGPECPRNASEAVAREHFLSVDGAGWALIFCSWDCVLRYGATIEPSEIIPFERDAE